MKKLLLNKQKLKEPFSITIEKGLFYFKIEDDDDRRKIVEEGPIFLLGRTFIIQPWSPDIEHLRDNINVIPIWEKLQHLPKDLQGDDDGISFAASMIGDPLSMDTNIAFRLRIDYVRVCVFITLGKSSRLSSSFLLKGKLSSQLSMSGFLICVRSAKILVIKPINVMLEQEDNGFLKAQKVLTLLPQAKTETSMELTYNYQITELSLTLYKALPITLSLQQPTLRKRAQKALISQHLAIESPQFGYCPYGLKDPSFCTDCSRHGLWTSQKTNFVLPLTSLVVLLKTLMMNPLSVLMGKKVSSLTISSPTLSLDCRRKN